MRRRAAVTAQSGGGVVRAAGDRAAAAGAPGRRARSRQEAVGALRSVPDGGASRRVARCRAERCPGGAVSDAMPQPGARDFAGSPDRFGYEWAAYAEILPEYEEQYRRWTVHLAPDDWRGRSFLRW